MARPLRIEFVGGLYHVTSRGNARQDIYVDNHDRATFLDRADKTRTRYDWYVHAYCLTSNHYHLLIETGTPTLSKGMKLLNGVYTQSFNRRHRRVGHLFQGRYKAILVDKESYLLELARYIVLNPVRARMIRSATDWKWSSYRATAGLADKEPLLTTDWILSGPPQGQTLSLQVQSKSRVGLKYPVVRMPSVRQQKCVSQWTAQSR